LKKKKKKRKRKIVFRKKNSVLEMGIGKKGPEILGVKE
jgi:hypothetical protein